jgi:hypothetical protein
MLAVRSIPRVGRTFRPHLEPLEERAPLSGLAAAPQVLEVRQGDPHAQFQTIQTAVNAAHPGDEILVFSGVYREAITVTTPIIAPRRPQPLISPRRHRLTRWGSIRTQTTRR